MRHSVFLLAAATLLSAGCGGGSSSSGFAPPSGDSLARSPGWSAHARSGSDLLYVSSLSPSEVIVYRQNGKNHKPIATITNGINAPYGMFVDDQRNLYVANSGSGTVTVYPAGSTSPSETLTGAGAPIQVTVSRDGTVYVANTGNLNNPSNASVLEYRRGHTRPSQTIIAFTKAGAYPSGVALDSSNNLYVAFNRPCVGCTSGQQQNRRGGVLRFSPGASKGKDLGIRVDFAEDLIIDDKNDLILGAICTIPEDPCSPWSRLYIYPPGHNVPSKELLIASGAVSQSLNHENSEIWTASPKINCPPCALIQAATYPGGHIVKKFDGMYGFEVGVATSPAGSE